MNRKNGILAGMLIFFCILAGILYIQFRPAVTTGTKTITVIVSHLDGTQNRFSYDTDAEYLGELLQEAALIDGEDGPFGIFITTVDGETADEGRQQWWSITKGGEAVTVGVDELPIADGDTFELTLMEGY